MKRRRVPTPYGHEGSAEHPRKKVLLLHGGPCATHEGLEIFEDYIRPDELEFCYYDQLGSHAGDQPDEPELWTISRVVDEVEQVRAALGLDAGNFFLLGQSWGGILAIEYALAHQEHLKGLVISNMMASVPAYAAYAENVLLPSMPPPVVKELRELEAAATSPIHATKRC